MPITGLVKNTVDLNQGVACVHLGRMFAESDGNAHTFEITVLASGKALSLEGANITGYFTRADDGTVFITNGEVEANTAIIKLPESCYAVEGHFSFIIRAVLNEYRTTIYWADGEVVNTITDAIIDPGKTVPNLDELLARIKEMEEKTAKADSAANLANTSAKEADDARDRANTSAKEADDARDRANTSAKEADDARDRANTSAKEADDARDRANAAADRVDASILTANTSAKLANEAAERAENAALEANETIEDITRRTDQLFEETKDVMNLANDSAENAKQAAAEASKWEDVLVTVEMKDSSFSPICTVSDRETGGKLLEFELPRGLTGLTPNISVGSVTTGEPGSDAIVTLSGTLESPIFNFTIPRGNTGTVENLSVRLTGDIEGYATAQNGGDIVINATLTKKIETISSVRLTGDIEGYATAQNGGDIVINATLTKEIESITTDEIVDLVES